jgi:Zn-dependent protease
LFFNLLPIPPLDGSHVLWNALGLSWESYFQAMRFGLILVIVAINIPGVRQFLGTAVSTSTALLGRVYGI